MARERLGSGVGSFRACSCLTGWTGALALGSDVFFADDITLVSRSLAQMQIMIDELLATLKAHQLELAAHKTKLL
eukprot:8658569-Prorocentrum_lima.AAC.1